MTEVSERTALVMQVFAPNTSTEAAIGSVSLVVEGRGGGNARAQAPRDAAIGEGDVVVSSRFRGLPIGVVGSITGDPASAHKEVYIGLPVNLATLRFVYVIPFGT